MSSHVVDLGRAAVEDWRPGGVEAGEVGAERLAAEVDQSMGQTIAAAT
jgi:hypothetical protein